MSGYEEDVGSRRGEVGRRMKKGDAQRDVVLQRRARRVGGCGARVGGAGGVGSACLRAKGRCRFRGAEVEGTEGARGAKWEHCAEHEVEKEYEIEEAFATGQYSWSRRVDEEGMDRRGVNKHKE